MCSSLTRLINLSVISCIVKAIVNINVIIDVNIHFVLLAEFILDTFSLSMKKVQTIAAIFNTIVHQVLMYFVFLV